MDEPASTTPQQSDLATLFAKKARIMTKLARIPKAGGGKDSALKYTYATGDDVFDAVRVAMAEENLALFVSMVDVQQSDLNGGKGTHTVATFEFTTVCGDTGAFWTDRWVSEANDYGDKSLNKVATIAQKYYLLRTFVLSTGDEADDPDSVADQNTPKRTQQDTPRIADKPAQSKAQHTPAKATGPRYEYEPVIAFTQQYLPERDDAINALKDMKKAGVINDGMTTEQVNAEVRRKLGPPLTDAEVAEAFEDLGKAG